MGQRDICSTVADQSTFFPTRGPDYAHHISTFLLPTIILIWCLSTSPVRSLQMMAEFFKKLTGIPLEKQLNLTKGLFEAICTSKGPLFDFTETIVCTALLENSTICIRPCRYCKSSYKNILRRPQNVGKSPS